MIVITNDEGKRMFVIIRCGVVEIIIEGHARMTITNDDARQVRDYLGNL